MSHVFFALLAAVCTTWTLAGIFAVWRTRRRPPRHSLPAPIPVSVLKPLRGVDEDLEANLHTFFEQEHPDFELVFGVEGEDDPALSVVRRLRRAYPGTRTRVVVHDGGRGINPKVSNLRAMISAVQHDVVVISDSNIAVPPDYLRRMCAELGDPRVGLVTSAFAGTGEQTLGATLENLHLNGVVAAGAALPTSVLGHPVVVGKSMMFRRSVLDRLGGFESVASVLAEDYVIGRMFHEAGFSVRVCAQPIRNVNARTSVRAFFDRHVRWGMIRVRMAPFAFLFEPLVQPLAVALLAPLFGVGLGGALAWGVCLTLLRDVAQWTALRGPSGLLRALPLFPVRDAIVLAAWISTFFRRHVVWRGNRVRVSAGTRLYAARENTRGTVALVD
jgi:ceramide glucosyltransferase